MMFEFHWPLCFLLLPLPWLYRRWLPPAQNRSAALQVGFMERLQALQPLADQPASAGRKWPFVVVWLLLLCAAARPQLLGESLPTAVTGRDMMLALDLSGSMEFRDMQLAGEAVDRLTLVKHLLGEFIDRRRGDRLGLILFGSQAYVQAPLTHDRQAIGDWLEESFIGLAGRETAIGDAIGLAIKRLLDEPAASRVLILITDGANTAGTVSPLRAARLAADHGIRIFTIGVGADTQAQDGVSVSLRGLQFDPSIELDEGSLQEIALLTGGSYFRARSEADLQAIYAQLDQLEPALRDGLPDRQATPLYPWPLALALLLSLSLSANMVRRSRAHA
ncbi:von Willebrand factor A [Pseudomonas saudimassiliensis]|uniref:von Willebrand factor A n=1 Tax=Pseudomonas saudimassiliensis TaxID=1461581 RepID=A0A078MGD1_9PSED|nr:VWA domain-containing protein [Pseudomonas saudimassiliensis]CEA06388.1 von Willebrand factor A [Pseudomonas saudimassiliensis]CEF27813.1 von Willebrand factor A [Pseudomonas saudimassiliensis]